MQCVAFDESRSQIQFQRQSSAAVGFKLNALQIDGCRATAVGVARVELTNFVEPLIRPVSRCRLWRKLNPVRQQHRMTGDVFSRIQIFLHQRRRHDKCIADIRKSFSRRTVDRELARGLQRNTGEILDGVGEFCVVQASQDHRPRIACVGFRVGIEHTSDPVSQGRVFGFRGLKLRILRRHLAIIHHLDDALPRHNVATHIGDRMKLLQIQFTLLFSSGMTTQTILLQHRCLRFFILRLKRGKLRVARILCLQTGA